MPKAAKSVGFYKARHPEYVRMAGSWEKWRLCYEGGDEFIEHFLKRYSRRELKKEFADRKEISYNPAHTTTIVDIVRNGLAAKLGEVSREGDKTYLDWCAEDVDLQKRSMASYLALEVLPMLLAQQKRFVVMNSPAKKAMSLTKAEDRGRPFLYAVSAEDVWSWKHDPETGKLCVVNMIEKVDVIDPTTDLVIGEQTQQRYMRYLSEGQTFGQFTGPGCLVKVMDLKDKDIEDPMLLPLSRLPVVEFRLAASLVKSLAQIQIAILNLASSDMSFLFRGNFPIFVKAYDPMTRLIKPTGTKRNTNLQAQDIDIDAEVSDPAESQSRRIEETKVGVNQGVGYEKGTPAPSFAAPPTSNVEASMKKQAELAALMRALADLALVSMSVSALEQSGKSKEADRVGKEEGMAHIGQALEAGEKELNELFHEFQGIKNDKLSCKYPTTYSVSTPEEREAEAKNLSDAKGEVGSEIFQKAIEKRIIDVLLKPLASAEDIAKAKEQVDKRLWFDESEARALTLREDMKASGLDKKTFVKLRGYPEEVATALDGETNSLLDSLAGPPGGSQFSKPLDPAKQVDANGLPIDPAKPPIKPGMPPVFK